MTRMTLDEYIEALEAIRAEHGGNLKVDTYGFSAARAKAPLPKIAYTQILEGRERVERFWYLGVAEHLKGEKVVQV